MKKILFILTLSATVTTYAQDYAQKGSWYLGGSAGFSIGSSSQGNNTLKHMSWSASPEVGTFLTDRIQLGLGITANGSTNSTSYKTLQFGGTVYSRYLFGDGAFRPFLGINAGYLTGQSRTNSGLPGDVENTISTINANFSAGFAYYVTPRIGILGSVGVIGYTNTRTTITGAPDKVDNEFGFNASTLGNRFTIGMYYTICPGKSSE